ncbi:hypothetical protein D3Z09_18305 [Rahnella aquatilis]|nr:hypothetical protein D3Z09_18305 [Rahnella aquatilis]
MKYRLRTLSGTAWRKGGLVTGGVLLCAVLSAGVSAAGSDTVSLTFTYTVMEGTCQVDVPASTINFGGAAGTEKTRDAIGQNWFFIGVRQYDIKLSQCAGSGMTGSNIPSIIVEGFLPATGSTNQRTYLMMPTTVETPSTGLGMVISQMKQTLVNGSTGNLSKIQGGKMYIDVGAANTFPAASTPVPLQIALACGDASDCTVDKLNPGTESMTLTFSFGYH